MGASFSGNRRSSTDRISPAGGSQPVAVHQKIVPARVVARGAGLRLSQKASIPALRRAIQRVLDEPGFRAQARHLAHAIAEETHRPLAAEALEELATHARVRAPVKG